MMLRTRRPGAGFSLIELMIVIVILLTITGAIFQVINLSNERSSTEQNKVDMFQEAREFMDQMSRDMRTAGYPNPRNMDPSVFSQNPVINDLHAAAGLVKVDSGTLWFEGDVDGSGSVSVVQYYLDTTTAGNCPCLRRSQLPKVNGVPYITGSGGQTPPAYQVEVQGVQNTGIFQAFADGATVTLPVDISSNGGVTIAGIDTIQVQLSLQSPIIDPKTGQKPVTTLVSTVKLNNCSQAAIGYKESCQ